MSDDAAPEVIKSEESPDTTDALAQVDTPETIEVPVLNDTDQSAHVDTPETIEAHVSNDELIHTDESTKVDTPETIEVPVSNDGLIHTDESAPAEAALPTDPASQIQIVISEDATTEPPNVETPPSSEAREGEEIEAHPSGQIETQPTLTDIREETEPVAELGIRQSLENVDYSEEPLVTVTSVLNLSGEEDIPEIRPSTPEVADQEVESDEIEGEQTDSLTELLEGLKLLKDEEEKVFSENAQMQHRLVEHFRSKRADERLGTAGEAERERGVTDYEQRYDKYLSVLQERQSEARKMREYSDQLLRSACDTEREIASELELVVKEESAFKQETMVSALDSRTGKHMSSELMERLLRDEAKKEAEVSSIRLENIKLSRNLAKREEQLRQKEEVAEGLHKIEFEQLKIEHQKNNEKIEDRNEDINRLRGKITRTVQVLTHVKEKQHFVASENTLQREQLADSDIQVAMMRDRLTYIKQSRDRLRGDSQRLQDKGGLVNHRKLLRDMEEKQDHAEDLESRLVHLKRRHAELSQLSDGIKQKISQTKASGSLSMLQVPH